MWQFTASLNWSVSRDTGRQGSQESGPILSPSPSSTHFHTLHPPGHLTKHKGYLLISPDLHTLRRLSNTLLDASVSHLSTLNTMPIPGRTICPVCYCCRFVHSSPPSPPPSLSFLSAWKWHLSPFPKFDPNQFSQDLICVFLIWDFGGKGLYQWPRAKGNLESHTFRFLTIKCVASATSLQNWYSWEEVEGGIYNNMSQRRNFFSFILSKNC